MKNRFLPAILTASLACAGLATTASAQDFKIGIVDMKRVFSEYYKTKDAEKSVNDGKEAAKKQLDERNAKYRELISKWQEAQKLVNDPAISEELRAQKRKESEELASEAKSLEREMSEFRQRREQQLQEQVGRMRKGILDEIRSLVEKKAKTENYDLVFDKSGLGVNGVPFLLHSKDAVDFSQEIVTDLNKDAPAEDAKPATPVSTPPEKKEAGKKGAN
ncbi:MAG: OmpH family outer membrane protein [Verrucomicrobiales bacterium]